ncbi:MAG: DUF1428 domain-containing protein [Anaeromyxobacteraceae bacterium]|nr:DUF1428 domain-containing protein [Anaeromyxobacteraceae bacterium]
MARYVDGFVIPIAKRKLKAYLVQARFGAALWKKHGALAYFECAGDDLGANFGLGFARMCRLKAGETVFFSFIVYRSRAHRDRVNAAVMADPKMAAMAKEMERAAPFDVKRMAMGGFQALVSW